MHSAGDTPKHRPPTWLSCTQTLQHTSAMPLAFGSRSQGKRMQGRTLHARQPLPARRTTVTVRAERSYVMVKPDGVQRGIVGNVITRFENKGFKIVGLKMYQTSKEVAEEHYKDLSEKPFYGKLVDYIISGPVVCIVRASSPLRGLL